MAASVITRTADTDDDGTGTTGTIRNAAWKTAIYQAIDDMFAGAGSYTTFSFGGAVAVPAAQKLYLDGGGDTYLIEASANDYRLFVGGNLLQECTTTAAVLSPGGSAVFAAYSSNNVAIPATGKVFLDGTGAAGDTYLTEASANSVTLTAGGTVRLTIGPGVQVGAPTGGDKGAGTINIAADIYKNNTAYANPDYVLEQWATGRIRTFAKNPGAQGYRLRSLAETEAYARRYCRLPRIHAAKGMFARADVILEKVEELHIHCFDLHRRIRALERKAAA